MLESASHHLQETPCILGIDMFHYLVALVLSLPVLYAEDDGTSPTLAHIPTGGLNDKHALQLVFTAHLVQIMLAADFEAHGGYFFLFFYILYISNDAGDFEAHMVGTFLCIRNDYLGIVMGYCGGKAATS